MNNVQGKTDVGFKITSDWDKHSKLLQERYPSLKDSDLKFETGKENELIARISARLNKKQDEVINIVKKDL